MNIMKCTTSWDYFTNLKVHCTEGLVSYEITSLGISGEIPIQRVAAENVPLCAALNEQISNFQ